MNSASIIAASAFLFATGACRKVYNQSVAVIRDASGVHLCFEGREYQVTNQEALEGYEHGARINATFMQVNECNGSTNSGILGVMLQENEGWIRVQRIH